MTQEAQEKKINNDEFLNITYINLRKCKHCGVTCLARFSRLAKDTLQKRGFFGRNLKLSISRLYLICKLLVDFQSLAQLYLQVLCIASFSQSAALTCNFITQENKISVANP